jgi:hypothetical protein
MRLVRGFIDSSCCTHTTVLIHCTHPIRSSQYCCTGTAAGAAVYASSHAAAAPPRHVREAIGHSQGEMMRIVVMMRIHKIIHCTPTTVLLLLHSYTVLILLFSYYCTTTTVLILPYSYYSLRTCCIRILSYCAGCEVWMGAAVADAQSTHCKDASPQILDASSQSPSLAEHVSFRR